MKCWLLVDVELGLASRSDLLQILINTVHGGRSVQGVRDGPRDGEQTRRLDKGMFPSGSLGDLSEPHMLGQTSPAGGNRRNSFPGDSPGPMFQMDSPAASGLSLPVVLERTQSSESVDFTLATQEPSIAGGNVFDMTDTAHDDDAVVGPSLFDFRQGQPLPSPAAAEEQQQRSPEQLLQQQLQQLPQQLPQTPVQQGPSHRRKLYAYGIADPEYMSLPCKMSMKHARVTVNHETNNRLYGKKLPGQVRPCLASVQSSPPPLPAPPPPAPKGQVGVVAAMLPIANYIKCIWTQQGFLQSDAQL